MKILIDIGHPKDVHDFKNFIKIMSHKGHKIKIIARNRDVVFSLLDSYGIAYTKRGTGRDSRFGKLLYMIIADIKIFFVALRFKPSVFLSFSSPYAAQVAFIMRKPHIAINDTEHTDATHSIFTYPFSQNIITPQTYQNSLGFKQVRINSIIEGFYLHKNYYNPNQQNLNELGLYENKNYVIIRFVSWNAHHDYGQSGLSLELKRELIKLLSLKYKVFISSEGRLDKEFEPYRINISPNKMHDVLNYASLFIGESATMAAECAYLGTPAVYINSLPLMCYLKLEQENGILKHFSSSEGVLEYVEALIEDENLKSNTIERSNQMKQSFIDPTAFLVWFIENYPSSTKIMKENPVYQYNFK